MPIALTRAVSPRIGECELTHLERRPIDFAAAHEEHERYVRRLAELGCTVIPVRPAPELPDSVFVEDIAVVFAEVAVLGRPGAASRRAETNAVAQSLAPFRRLVPITAPDTLDGGDVLVLGSTVFVGVSARTTAGAAVQLERLLRPLGYRVRTVEVGGCLHLKTAATAVAPDRVLVNPAWVDPAVFGTATVEVDPREPFGANALSVGGVVLYPQAFPRTRERLERAGLTTAGIAVGELAKAEAGLTCCSIVFEA
jgi:dimethylargininase